MLRHHRGLLLRDWIQNAELSGPDAVGVFAGSVRQDLHAVTADLTRRHRSGNTEGHVERIDTIKRQLSGRASFNLLRARFLRRQQSSRKRGQNPAVGRLSVAVAHHMIIASDCTAARRRLVSPPLAGGRRE